MNGSPFTQSEWDNDKPVQLSAELARKMAKYPDLWISRRQDGFAINETLLPGGSYGTEEARYVSADAAARAALKELAL